MERKKANPPDGKCQSINKDGEPCGAHAVRGKSYCSLHLTPSRASDLGRKGEQKNRIVKTPESGNEPLRIPQNVSEIEERLREAFALVSAGRMNSSQATCLVAIAHALFKGQQVVEHDRRISLIEKQLREKSTGDSVSPLSSLDDPDPEEQEAAAESSKPC